MFTRKMNLHLFEGEGGSPAASEGDATPAAIKYESPTSKAKKGAESAKVAYGIQEQPVAQVEAQTATENKEVAVDRKAEFEKMIQGDYKDIFGERTQEIINKRFKETKQLEKFTSEVSPVVELLARKYGIDANDPAALRAAIEADDAYWEELAESEGLTVEQYKMKQRLEMENAQLKQMQEKVNQEKRTGEIYAEWQKEAEGLKGTYPEFDLQAECQNKQFVDLLARQIDMKTAYEVVHMNDIKQSVAKQAQTRVADTIRATGSRPSENGASAQSGVLVKNNVGQLTKEDRAAIAQRVARGENIKF